MAKNDKTAPMIRRQKNAKNQKIEQRYWDSVAKKLQKMAKNGSF